MSPVGDIERITQERVISLFSRPEGLGYTYLGNWHDRPDNSNIEEGLLSDWLRKNGYNQTLISRAIYELKKAAGIQNKNLYSINKAVYTILRYGAKVKEDVGETTSTVRLIDWEDPSNNHFAIAEEVSIKGENRKRPDIVIYVNGIALGVLELKRSTVSVSQGIRQNLDNQKSMFIMSFFATVQLVMAGNDTEGLRYGVINTPEKYYLKWKEESDTENLLDRHLLQICSKERFLELIHDFIVFDAGVKKVCRHNQFFGVKALQKRVKEREGGIIWQTQGSGKSMIMVWLTRWIRENIKDARVLIITDRDELDKQIEKVFKGVDEQIHRTTSGRDLVEKLNVSLPWLMCSLIHKFGNKEEADYEGFIEDISRYLPRGFSAKGDVYVYVDECHRTQSGELHKAMKKILPNAMFIGFTGTPLLKTDKQRSIEIFGSYIHTYKFDEAVKDNVILDLRYEARDVDQRITSQEKIDKWFEAKTRGLTGYAKMQLKQKWGTMQTILSSQSRLEKIVADIMLDMETKDRLKSGYGNAMLVSGSIYEACKYYELFQNAGLKKCAIVTSYVPVINDIRGESIDEESTTDKLKKYEAYQRMLNGKSAELFEDEVKRTFVNEPGQMKLLIVVDKLLTGFDAPSATYLYIDKKMQDHGLFQAICRVNRLDGEDKDYGYIIDYKDLFRSLESSVHDYTSGALDGYDREDVAGLLTDRLQKAKELLDNALESIRTLSEPVKMPKETIDYIRYFCAENIDDSEEIKRNEQKRLALYKQVSHLVRTYAAIANEMAEAGYTPSDAENIFREVRHYENARAEVKLASADYIDLKAYEPAMRHLIDTYISAEESRVISAFDDLSLVELIVERGEKALENLPEGIRKNRQAAAETIENNLRKVIHDEQPINPKYYEKISRLLDELIARRREEAIEYEEYLAKIVELTRQIKRPNETKYPKVLDTRARRALYDNLDQNEELALLLDYEVIYTKKDAWRGNMIKEREVLFAIKKHIKEEEKLKQIFEIVKNQPDY
ncbi:MAG: HsdR family type I site-specific deoxyribonuclease [Bacteroidales bacterium]|nr:HsdR family type I site-specific deoxyribonuclease [Bacteroidales bacterium]